MIRQVYKTFLNDKCPSKTDDNANIEGLKHYMRVLVVYSPHYCLEPAFSTFKQVDISSKKNSN